MPQEAIPIEFQGTQSTLRAAEAINEALSRGEYIGHIAITGTPSLSTGISRTEGIVLLVNTAEDIKDETPLYKHHFVRVWNAQGAGQAWQKLIRISNNNESFPLRLAHSEDGEVASFVGDLDAALNWLYERPQTTRGRGVVEDILELIIKERKERRTQ